MLGVKIAEFTSFMLMAGVVVFFVFQLFVPAIMGTPLFPILRHKRRAAENKLAEALEEKGVREIEESAANILGNATAKRKGR
jgi:hypothetical protein